MNTGFVFIGCAVLLGAASTSFGQLQNSGITARAVHPKVVLLTHDDGFDEAAPDGSDQTMAVARKMYAWGLPATFFLVGCHFTGMFSADARSSECIGLGDRPRTLLQKLADLDF